MVSLATFFSRAMHPFAKLLPSVSGVATVFLVLMPAASVHANLVVNGDFEDSSSKDPAEFPTSVGGIGQIDNIVSLPGWTKASVVNDGSDGFGFVVNQDADYKIPGSSFPNQGGGFPSKFTKDASTNIFLWGPDYGPNPQNNGFSGPPGSSAGNKFLGFDGDYGASTLSQTVVGFDISKKYVFSFDYAGAQETGETGPTNQQWKVTLGGSDYSTPTWVNPGMGFTGWQTFTSSAFTPAANSLALTFESWGRAVTSGSLPPFLLLDNVKIIESQNPQPPTPSVPGPLPALGIGLTVAWSRKLRRRISSPSKR